MKLIERLLSIVASRQPVPPPASSGSPKPPPRDPSGRRSSRMYHAARQTRNTVGFGAGGETSADAELDGSLRNLRTRSRQLVRDAAYAKRAKIVVVNNVIGQGVAMQANIRNNRKRLVTEQNDAIEKAWTMWSRAENCHTGGKLHFADLERAGMGQIFEAGEVIFRKHLRRFGSSAVPMALELIEAERICDTMTISPTTGNDVRMGIEVDAFQRPVAVWFRRGHPGDVRRTDLRAVERHERVPMEQLFHLYVVDRWPQSRGEPWLHATARRLNDMDGYSEAEIIAARNSANIMGFVKRAPDVGAPMDPGMADEKGEDGQRIANFEPGAIEYLEQGEDFIDHNPSRPNVALDPFMRYMLREVAAGIGVSYESLSRDYSQSNYSSSRLSLLDDRDTWRVLQSWWIRNFREPLHREWLRQAIYANAITTIPTEQYISDASRFEMVRFKPRGWTWIDPSKEVDAKIKAVQAGFTTVSAVIAETGDGKDLEDVIAEREAELEYMEEHGLQFTTDPQAAQPAAAPPTGATAPADLEDPEDPEDPAEDPEDVPARVISLR
jgi:lambda family phage portal protein